MPRHHFSRFLTLPYRVPDRKHRSLIPAELRLAELPQVPITEWQLFPDKPGIYFVLSRYHHVLYIGEAESIARRWRTHHRSTQLMQMGHVWLAWILLPTWDLSAAEQECLDRWPPLLNACPQGKKSQMELLASFFPALPPRPRRHCLRCGTTTEPELSLPLGPACPQCLWECLRNVLDEPASLPADPFSHRWFTQVKKKVMQFYTFLIEAEAPTGTAHSVVVSAQIRHTEKEPLLP